MLKTTPLLFLLFALFSCNPDTSEYYKTNNPYEKFETFEDFRNRLTSISDIRDNEMRDSVFNILWDSLRINGQIPFVLDTQALFMYRGDANKVFWTGDFCNWNKKERDYKGKRIRKLDLWILEKTFELDARFNYKIEINNSNSVIDSANLHTAYNGIEISSELRMPEWEPYIYTQEDTNVKKGTLSDAQTIHSKTLNYNIQYKVYTPYNYESLTDLPTIYVFDGQDYCNPLMGGMKTQLDNLIDNQIIEPVIAVFIDSRNPENQTESRNPIEFSPDSKYPEFLAYDLVPQIDARYTTSSDPSKRAILAHSNGAGTAIYTAITQFDTFNLVGAQSATINDSLMREYGKAKKLPLSIYLTTGTYFDDISNIKLFRNILIYKGYNMNYMEINQAPCWTNWQGQIEDILTEFFYKKLYN